MLGIIRDESCNIMKGQPFENTPVSSKAGPFEHLSVRSQLTKKMVMNLKH